MATVSKDLRFLSLNCHGVNDSIITYLRRIIVDYDIVHPVLPVCVKYVVISVVNCVSVKLCCI